jgi:UDP-N-acetylglucosamine 2-epimerase
MKVVSIVGARPQFIKAAVLSRELRKQHNEILVHTGQHYDQNMSDIFFQELGIAHPEYNLGIGSGSHGKQTGAMLAAIEEILLNEKPDWVIVYGDTNSTLAGALAATKLHIKLAHVEAGLRSYNRKMPEEINRVLTDHISDLLLCPTQTAVDNLKFEGITHGVHLVGDLMYEALTWAVEQEKDNVVISSQMALQPKKYILATIHRAENTDDPNKLRSILDALNNISELIVWPVHPRTEKKLEEINWRPSSTIHLIKPTGYLEMVKLEKNARVIITDSGGIQKEAYWLGVPCVTLRDETEWIETVQSGWNQLSGTNTQSILKAIKNENSTNRKTVNISKRIDSNMYIDLLENNL